VLIGDSHAAHWIPALDVAARAAGIRLVPFVKSACPASEVAVFDRHLNRRYRECDAWRDRVFELVDELRPDIVLATQSSAIRVDPSAGDDPIAALEDGWVATLTRLGRTGAAVTLLSDTPYADELVPDCLSAHPDDAGACTMARQEGIRFQHSTIEAQAAHDAGVRYLRTESLLCGPTRCPVIVGDLLVYRDTSHMTTPFSEWLSAPLAALLGAPWS
jgi:hypothetical protein